MRLRSKFIIALLAVSLVPLAIIEYLNITALRAQLEAERLQVLEGLAAESATMVDGFISGALDSVRTQAQLPTVVEYLRATPEVRERPEVQEKAIALLRALTLRDRVHISSYAIIDLSGETLLDTWGSNLGRDRSSWSFFHEAKKSQRPYVSPVLFDDDPADRGASNEVGIYFSSPVRDSNTSIIGFLVCRYRVALLQQLMAGANGRAGSGSYGLLLDENGLVLAHGTSPTSTQRLAAAPAAARIGELLEARRIPWSWQATGDTLDPDHLFEPEGGDFATAEHTLETRPWTVRFLAPVDNINAPAREQTRKTVMAGVASAIVVAFLAWIMAGVLARPIRRMTTSAATIAKGDYDVRVELTSRDELGELAGVLNTMTERVADLVSTLEQRVAERTQELEESNQKLQRGLELAERQKSQIASLNEELRRQIRERSRTLGEALQQLSAESAADNVLQPGQMIDDTYRIEEFLGAGAMGAVYRSTRVYDEHEVALKVLTRNTDRRAMVRFAREAQLAATIVSPYVVEIIDVGLSDSGIMYLAMQLVRGGSLRDRHGRYGDHGWALRVIEQVARGLSAIHEQGVIHRDLKPSNVMLARQSAGPESLDGSPTDMAKISDFGISSPRRATEGLFLGETRTEDQGAQRGSAHRARSGGDNAASRSLAARESITRTGAIMGTPLYMAPELVHGVRYASPASDIYSLGVLAYELLCSTHPYEVPAFIAAQAQIDLSRQRRRPLGVMCPEVPARIVEVLERAIAFQPAQRPGALEIAEVIQAES